MITWCHMNYVIMWYTLLNTTVITWYTLLDGNLITWSTSSLDTNMVTCYTLEDTVMIMWHTMVDTTVITWYILKSNHDHVIPSGGYKRIYNYIHMMYIGNMIQDSFKCVGNMIHLCESSVWIMWQWSGIHWTLSAHQDRALECPLVHPFIGVEMA